MSQGFVHVREDTDFLASGQVTKYIKELETMTAKMSAEEDKAQKTYLTMNLVVVVVVVVVGPMLQ